MRIYTITFALCFPQYKLSLLPIHNERNWRQKRNFSLMFVIYSLIFLFACHSTILRGANWPSYGMLTLPYTQTPRTKNKNAFLWDPYRLLQWLPLDVTTGGWGLPKGSPLKGVETRGGSTQGGPPRGGLPSWEGDLPRGGVPGSV